MRATSRHARIASPCRKPNPGSSTSSIQTSRHARRHSSRQNRHVRLEKRHARTKKRHARTKKRHNAAERGQLRRDRRHTSLVDHHRSRRASRRFHRVVLGSPAARNSVKTRCQDRRQHHSIGTWTRVSAMRCADLGGVLRVVRPALNFGSCCNLQGICCRDPFSRLSALFESEPVEGVWSEAQEVGRPADFGEHRFAEELDGDVARVLVEV
jgi:hypothetical protein